MRVRWHDGDTYCRLAAAFGVATRGRQPRPRRQPRTRRTRRRGAQDLELLAKLRSCPRRATPIAVLHAIDDQHRQGGRASVAARSVSNRV